MWRIESIAQGRSAKASHNAHGLAGHLLELIGGFRGRRRAVAARQMHLVETLPLGGKRQLMLVECAGERFLIGGGLESVETIVQIAPAVAQQA
ncbi:MAG TPA: flagellar biosynthetic protein FliO, partial [Edaphobacter sp.]|nr:flagellar biosynthetic protein FliO [Edaphobacter sp.]